MYPQVDAGQEVPIPWREKDYKMACCDCHLVHRLTFRVDGDTLYMSGVRDNRSTAALRRNRGIPMFTNEPAITNAIDGNDITSPPDDSFSPTSESFLPRDENVGSTAQVPTDWEAVAWALAGALDGMAFDYDEGGNTADEWLAWAREQVE